MNHQVVPELIINQHGFWTLLTWLSFTIPSALPVHSQPMGGGCTVLHSLGRPKPLRLTDDSLQPCVVHPTFFLARKRYKLLYEPHEYCSYIYWIIIGPHWLYFPRMFSLFSHVNSPCLHGSIPSIMRYYGYTNLIPNKLGNHLVIIKHIHHWWWLQTSFWS